MLNKPDGGVGGRFLLFFLDSVVNMIFNILIVFCFFSLLEIKKASLVSSETLEILFLRGNKPN